MGLRFGILSDGGGCSGYSVVSTIIRDKKDRKGVVRKEFLAFENVTGQRINSVQPDRNDRSVEDKSARNCVHG